MKGGWTMTASPWALMAPVNLAALLITLLQFSFRWTSYICFGASFTLCAWSTLAVRLVDKGSLSTTSLKTLEQLDKELEQKEDGKVERTH